MSGSEDEDPKADKAEKRVRSEDEDRNGDDVDRKSKHVSL